MYVIEDESHAEVIGEFPDAAAAVAELRRIARLPWDQPPNRAPCTNWRACGRRYELVEVEVDGVRWTELHRRPTLEISASGVKWSADLPHV